MDPLNWVVIEMLNEQRARETQHGPALRAAVAYEAREKRGRVKRALASSLVRLGLRLDPAAGEGLGAMDLTLGRQEAGRQA